MMALTAQLSSLECTPAAALAVTSSKRLKAVAAETHPSMLKLRGRIWADALRAKTGASRKNESLIVNDGITVGVVV
jgi:hypothetical protein